MQLQESPPSGLFFRRICFHSSIVSSGNTVVIYNNNHNTILLTKTAAAQNEDALSYHRVRGLYCQAVVLVATILYFLPFHHN